MNVKLKYVALAVLLSLVGFSYGQNSPDYIHLKYDTTGRVTKTIVRAFEDNSISYIERGGKHYFTAALYDGSFIDVGLKIMEIDASYNVNDFKIIDKVLYFCGNYVKNGKTNGLVGFLNVSDFINGNPVDFNIQKSFGISNNDDNFKVLDLHKIELFYANETFHIVTIGKTSTPEYCILELLPNSLGESNGVYYLGVLDELSEVLNDIAVADNYVITVGSLYSGTTASIRRFSKNGISSDTSLCNTAYIYPSNNDSQSNYWQEDLTDFLITPVQNDIVTIASYWFNPADPITGNNLRGTMLRFYNIATLSAPTMMSSLSLGQTYYNGGWKLKELDYEPSSQAFTLLQEMEISANSLVSLFTTLCFTCNQTLHSIGYSNIEFTSFDNINGTHTVMTGFHRNPSTYFMLVGDRINSQNFCLGNSVNLTLSSRSIYGEKKEREKINYYYDDLLFNSTKIKVFDSTYFDNSCMQ